MASNHNILVLFAIFIFIFVHVVLLLGLSSALDTAHHSLIKVEVVVEMCPRETLCSISNNSKEKKKEKKKQDQ